MEAEEDLLLLLRGGESCGVLACWGRCVAIDPVPVSPRGSAPRLELFLRRCGRTFILCAEEGAAGGYALPLGVGAVILLLAEGYAAGAEMKLALA